MREINNSKNGIRLELRHTREQVDQDRCGCGQAATFRRAVARLGGEPSQETTNGGHKGHHSHKALEWVHGG